MKINPVPSDVRKYINVFNYYAKQFFEDKHNRAELEYLLVVFQDCLIYSYAYGYTEIYVRMRTLYED